MTSLRAAISGVVVAFSVLGGPSLSAQSPTDLVGVWTINRQLSQFPKEVGFSASFLPTEPPAWGLCDGNHAEDHEFLRA